MARIQRAEIYWAVSVGLGASYDHETDKVEKRVSHRSQYLSQLGRYLKVWGARARTEEGNKRKHKKKQIQNSRVTWQWQTEGESLIHRSFMSAQTLWPDMMMMMIIIIILFCLALYSTSLVSVLPKHRLSNWNSACCLWCSSIEENYHCVAFAGLRFCHINQTLFWQEGWVKMK